MSDSGTELTTLQQGSRNDSFVQEQGQGQGQESKVEDSRSNSNDILPSVPNAASVEEGPLQEFSLPPLDGGKDAWLFLAASFMMEALVWGKCRISLKWSF